MAARAQPPGGGAFALNPDGAASDPAAFRAALRADASKMAALEADPELREILLEGEIEAMQALLQRAHQIVADKERDIGRWMAERTIDAQRASATVPRDTVQLYKQLAESGLQYGPAFRLLRNVHVPDMSA